jgi:hypothetical protein
VIRINRDCVRACIFLGRYDDPATLGDMANAIVYYGNIKDVKVHPNKQ